jgi:hypothetical protein
MNSVLYPGQFVMGEAKPCLRRAKKEEKADMDKKAMVKAFKEKAAKEKAAKEKVAKEKAAKEKAAKEKTAMEKAAVEKATMEKAAIDEAAMEAAMDRAAMDKVALDRAAMEKASMEKAAKDKADSELATKEKARSKDSGAQTIGINAIDSVEQPTVPESTVFSCQALNPGPGMIILEPVTVEQKVIFGMLATVGLIKNVSDSAHLGSRGHFAFVQPEPREKSEWLTARSLLAGNDGRPPVSVGPRLDSRCFSDSVTSPESKGVDEISSSAKRMKPDPEYDLTIASFSSDKDGLNNFSYSTQ